MRRKIKIILILIVFAGNISIGNIGFAVDNINEIDEGKQIINKQNTIQDELIDNKAESDLYVKEGEKLENDIVDSEEIDDVEKSSDDLYKEKIFDNETFSKEKQLANETKYIKKLKIGENKPIIENGTYRISLFGNSYCHKALEIENGSIDATANVQIGTWLNKDNDKNKFKVTYDEESGYYEIQSVKSGKMLDVQNGGMTSGTNVWQHNRNGTDAQKWMIEDNPDGSYSIISKKNGLCLNVQNLNNGGNNITVNTANYGQEQKFQFIALDKIDEPEIDDGIYKIETSENSNKVIEVKDSSNENGANIQIGNWTKTVNKNKKFEITYNKDDGYYTIKNLNSNKVLDAQNGGMTTGTNIWQYDSNYTDAQRWKIERNSDDSYSLICKKSGLYLNVNQGNIEIANKTSDISQKFKISKVDKLNENEKIKEGTYKIVVASNENLSIDVNDASREKTANIQLGKTSNTIRNEFNIVSDGNEYYEIISVNSGNVLDVQNGGMTPETNVWQHGRNGTDAQKWIIEYNENDNTYSIKSKKNGLYIDVQNGIMTNGNNIQVHIGNGTKAQKFNFVEQEIKTEKYVEDGLYKILTKPNSLAGFDIESASKNNGGILQIWQYQNVSQQQFNITYKNGYYYIINKNSNKAMQANQDKILQYDIDYNNENQKWILKQKNGYYSFISKATEKSITIPNNEVSNGTDLKQENYNEKDCQLFKIIKATNNVTYKIVMASNENLCIDIQNAYREKTANAQLGNTSSFIRNEFNLILAEDGYYVISSINSGNVLDVQNGGMLPGTNVWQHGSNGTDAQKWKLEYNQEDGTYSIISKKNGLYLDVQDGNLSSGNNIQVHIGNGTKAQKFKLAEQENKTERFVLDGTYKFTTKINENIVFDIESANINNGGILQIWQYEYVSQQKFYLRYIDGYYYIINENSNKAIQTIGNKVLQYDINYNNENQKWVLKYFNGYYSIISYATGLAIEIPNSDVQNGVDLTVGNCVKSDNQLFNIQEPKPKRVIKLEIGYYGSSGLQVKGDSRGSALKYYKIGNGPNVFFGTFAVHGFEDLWSYDGQELTKIAEKFKNRLIEMQDFSLDDKWTIYIFPSVNPDGEYWGYTNNGPGRTSLYSSALNNKGIDINRCWSTSYICLSDNRNYNGTAPFQSYEAYYLRDFLLNKRATNGQTVLVDLHGWLNETIGDDGIGAYYRNQFGMSKHIYTYGSGYLVNWSRTNLGYNGRTARATLVELPEVSNSWQVEEYGFGDKYINATINMLRDM